MLEKSYETQELSNKAWLSGRLEEEFDYIHEVYGEEFYKNKVIVPRLSGVNDCIPIMVSNRVTGDLLKGSFKEKFVNLFGQFRSHNRFGDDGKFHLELFFFVIDMELCSEDEIIENESKNSIYLEGYICKAPNYRVTPFGREIADILLAVNRRFDKSDYIPCIVWGRNAQFAQYLEVGTKIQCEGRIQSRQYQKLISEETNEFEMREVYEISISQITVLD